MKNGIRNKLCSIVVAVSVYCSTSSSVANAQDGFREFDRKMVATPAELFEALSTFQPPRQRKEIDAQRQKEIEAAGRQFLSKLSPDQQEKAWEFAEKYLRKNGVDSSSSQKLMKDFGLPPEMQSELSKQFRKYSNRSSNSNAPPDSDPDDAISQILRKARGKFDRDSQSQNIDSERADPLNRDRPDTDADAGRDQGNPRELQATSERNRKTEDAGDSNFKEQSTDNSKQSGQGRDAAMDQPNTKAQDDRTDSQTGPPTSPFELPASRSTSPATKANPDSQSRLSEPKIESAQGKKGGGSDVDIDQLLKRLDGLKKNIENSGRTGSNAGGQSPSSEGDLDWEKVIKNLAEKGSVKEDTNLGSGASRNAGSSEPTRLDQGLLDRAKELISGSFNSEKNSAEGSLDRASPSNTAAEENVGARFDRLLVKAAERSLKSGDKEGVSKGAGSILGSLIERIQKQASDKESDREATGQNSAGSESGDNRNYRASTEDGDSGSNSSGAINSNDRSNRDAGSARENLFSPSASNYAESSFDPRKILDSITELSTISPTQVFTLFGIVGLVLFVGYLLAKSLVGDEVKTTRRKVIQQLRNTKIKSPQDLVETVDKFLLGKFGIKSSWWNARLAQRVLNSGSPEFQARVDELIQDYVRARYMRDDVQIPSAEQQRYKKTLEELSALDIIPDSNLGFVPSSPAPVSPASVEG